MNRNLKLGLIGAVTAGLFIYWLVLYFTSTKLTMANYWWEIFLALLAIMGGIFGMLTAKKWSWLKSGVGQGVFFISLGLVTWGIGQAGWSYAVIRDPSQQVPTSRILDIIFFSSIPLWMYGMIKLSKATGAKYGLKSNIGKLLVVIWSIFMIGISYYFLIVVARGGTAYFDGVAFWDAVYDLGYAFGDAINMTIAIAIFGLSWKYLGGRFKKPIITILLAYALIYLADFSFSYFDGKGQYFNGHWNDLVYLTMVATLSVALCMLDPSSKKNVSPEDNSQPATNQVPPAN